MSTEKIKGRIRALLSKTIDNGASKAEMESALNKANQLMTEHFISEHDLKDVDVIEKCIFKSVPLTKSGFNLSLFYADMCQLFDCEHYFTSANITFFGHSQDVEFCVYFYEVITRTTLIEKDRYLATPRARELKIHYPARTLSASFIKGFLIEIAIKMRKMYEERKSNIPESYSLMVIQKIDKVKNEFENQNLKIKKARDPKLSGVQESFSEGLNEGKKFNLSQGIENEKKYTVFIK